MKKFEWKPFLKNVAVIAVPVALQNLLTTTGSMVDTIMLAPLGQNTVGAVGLCAQLTSLLFSCYWGFLGGGAKSSATRWPCAPTSARCFCGFCADGTGRAARWTWTSGRCPGFRRR